MDIIQSDRKIEGDHCSEKADGQQYSYIVMICIHCDYISVKS